MTPEVLEKAQIIKDVFQWTPRLVLVPYHCTLDQMIQSIDLNKIKWLQKADTYHHESSNKNLWNNWKPFEIGEKPQWWWMIVDAITNPIPDPDISWKMNHYKQTKALLKKIQDQNLTPLSTARKYLSLMILSLGENNPIDQKTWTILNAESLKEWNFLAGGSWRDGGVGLFCWNSVYSADSLRLRSVVGGLCGKRSILDAYYFPLYDFFRKI